jgi:addiction module RelE/StbE family toxin
MKVQWTQAALDHLTDIHHYIAKDSPIYAQRMVDRITARSQQLETHPESGERVAEYNLPQIRQIIEGPYRIIYRVAASSVDVLAVIHGARQLPETV